MALPGKFRKAKAPKPGRVNQAHRKWVRSHSCCVPGCKAGPIIFAHVRLGIPAGVPRGGMGQKPADVMGVSLCSGHHDEQHNEGEATFAARHGIDLVALALEFAAKSPALREATRAA